MLGTTDATAAVTASLQSALTDAVLSTEIGTGLTFTTVGPPHVTGTARLEDGRPSLDMAVRGAWRAATVESAAAAAAGRQPPAEVAGSYAIDRIVDDPEFAGGIGPLSPVLTADEEGGGGGGGGGGRGGGRGRGEAGHALSHLQARAPTLADKVKAAVHAGLAAAAGAA